jgi:hypothetical protein
MANTRINHITQWDTYHFNGPFPTKILLDTDTDRTIRGLIDRYNDCTREIQSLLQNCIDNHERFRAFGSKWSLSNVAHQSDQMLYTGRLNIRKEVTQEQVHPQSTYDAENLFLFQCGTTVKEISEFLLKKGKSLKACGASNGQTIAGAISTGVHGAAIDAGSIQDCVVGLQLIVGTGPTDVIYLERETRPALHDDFVESLNARVVRNDKLFNAALVSLGAFGVIHGVVIEAEDGYLLKRYVRKISKADALQLATTMNFAHARFKIPSEIETDGTGKRPYHYKLYINPYTNEDFVTEIIYKKPYRSNYPNPVPLVQKAIFKDIPTWIAIFAARHKRIIPAIIKALSEEVFPAVDDDIEGTLGEIFWDTSQSSAAFSCGFGIDISDAERALNLYIQLMKDKGPIPGILSMRFVKASEATLAFTRFPITCVLEVDGVPWQGNANMITLDAFLTEVIKAFRADHIEFTLHWGKNAPWGFLNLVDMMYGQADDTWKDMRSVLLTKQMADVFSNDFLNIVKLSDYRTAIPNDLVALRDTILATHV